MAEWVMVEELVVAEEGVVTEDDREAAEEREGGNWRNDAPSVESERGRFMCAANTGPCTGSSTRAATTTTYASTRHHEIVR